MFVEECETRISYSSKACDFFVIKIDTIDKKDWWINISGRPDFAEISVCNFDEFIADLQDLKKRLGV